MHLYFVFLQKTATKAVVEMAKNQAIAEGGFQLLVLLAELHVPRMWVEQNPENPDSRV
jgi:poly [ADP-ribose] polymerase